MVSTNVVKAPIFMSNTCSVVAVGRHNKNILYSRYVQNVQYVRQHDSTV